MKVPPTSSPNKRLIIMTGAALLGVIIFFCLISSAYFARFDHTMTMENRAHLSEVSAQIAAYTTAVTDNTISMLEITAAAVDRLPEPQRLSFLEEISQSQGFTYLGWADQSGRFYKTEPAVSDEIADEPYFQAALRGESTVTGMIRIILEDRAASGILIAVPLGSPQAPEGALVAMLDIRRLQQALSIDSFGSAGYSYIIDQQGELVLRSKSMDYNNFYLLMQNVQFRPDYSLEKVRDDIQAGQEGLTLYDNLGTEQYAYYRPLTISDWTIVTIVAKEVVYGKTASLTKELSIIGVITLLIFLFLLLAAASNFILSESRRRATEAKSAFLANMSHEIRTPMNAITGMAAIADLHAEDPQRVRECLRKITLSSKHLVGLVNDILDMSKIESGHLELVREPFSLPEVIESVVTMIRSKAQTKQLTLQVLPLAIEQEYLLGDSLRLSQVLINLLSNAVKFTPEQGLVRFTLSEQPQNGAIGLRFIIEDNGCGMDQKTIQTIFQPFVRASDTTTSKIEGTGLGLAITKHIIDQMNGQITVESEPGRGSRFTVSLSLAAAPQTKREPLLPEKERRTLIIEPWVALGRVIADTLGAAGYPAQCAANGSQAALLLRQAQAEAAPFGLLLFSADAPDPAAVIDQLQQGPAASQPHILLMAYDWSDAAPIAQLLPEAIFLPRPFFLSTFTDAILRLQPEGTRSAPTAEDRRQALTGRHILVAEDNDLNAEILIELLQMNGLTVTRANNGQLTVEAFAQAPPGTFDAILMDIQMPVQNGTTPPAPFAPCPQTTPAPFPSWP